MEIQSDKRVKEVFDSYPDHVRNKMLHLRELVIETASEIEGVNKILETLKWGEPSYLVKKGTTLRMDWKAKKPDQYAMYFQCTSMMIPTIKKVFGDTFKYHGSRAVIFDLGSNLSEADVKECIKMALTYHRNKHLAFLGH